MEKTLAARQGLITIMAALFVVEAGFIALHPSLSSVIGGLIGLLFYFFAAPLVYVLIFWWKRRWRQARGRLMIVTAACYLMSVAGLIFKYKIAIIAAILSGALSTFFCVPALYWVCGWLVKGWRRVRGYLVERQERKRKTS